MKSLLQFFAIAATIVLLGPALDALDGIDAFKAFHAFDAHSAIYPPPPPPLHALAPAN